MREKLTARLVFTATNQRFYELSRPIEKGRRFHHDVDIIKELEADANRINPDLFETSSPESCSLICVSDAHTHTESLVFAAMTFRRTPDSDLEYGRMTVQIDGSHTMSIHGGDSSAVYPDEVYLKHLAIINGFSYAGLTK